MPVTARRTANGSLAVGGVDLVDLADELGTPLFVYDEAHLRARCKEALAAFGPGVAYGTKAFLCKAMAEIAFSEGMSLDIATGGELAVALAAGVPGDHLVMHGSNKTEAELAHALEARSGRIVVDSLDEVDRLVRLQAGGHFGDGGVDVLVRVTPGVEAHTHEYVMTGQEDTKFGFSLASGAADEAVAALRAIPGTRVTGAHAHVGSQIFRVDVYAQEVAAIAPFVRRHGLSECCIGGGLGVAYLNGETA
ncbi:MAG: diaminopimelate decarboxylase family protein, partial [Acidimicrobiales bacterium]